MTTKDIRTSQAHTVCDICGRTLLRGERAETYINGGARRSVCELCKPRALNEGWVREGTLPDYNQSKSGSDRRRSLFNRLRRRDGSGRGSRGRYTLDDELSDRSWEPPASYEPPPAYEPPASYEPRPAYEPPASYESPPAYESAEEDWDEPVGDATQAYTVPDAEPYTPETQPYRPPEPYSGPDEYASADPLDDRFDAPELGRATDPSFDEDEQPRRRPWSRRPRSLENSEPRPTRQPRRPRPSGQPAPAPERRVMGREPRHVRAVPSSQEQKMAAAVSAFNQSEHRRTVAGVARSLGGASVAVLPAAEPPSLVHIVVCWELCWYRYAVDLSDEGPGVRVEGQGYELSELSDADRAANAAADESGQLILL